MVVTRRELLHLLGAGAAAGAVGCGDNITTRDIATAILEPTSDRMIVTVWARRARSAIVEVKLGDDVMSIPIDLDGSGSGAIDLAGLAPATAYEVSITTSDGLRVGPHVARTAPADNDPRPVRIAVFADVDPSPEYDSDLIEHVIAAEPDLLVGLGDFPYSDNGPIAETLAAYRDRHAETRSLPKVRALLEAAPLRAIYDDHEFRNNWDAAFAAAEASRYDAAITVWDEFFPVRENERANDERHRSWRWGANVECFLLDTRRHRSPNAAPDDANKTMLGTAQLAWFQDAIAHSTATFKLVFTSVPLDFGTGADHWATFATERAVVLDALVGIRGVVVFAADQHWFAAHRHLYGVREFQIGPLARGPAPFGPLQPGVLFRDSRFNVGLIDISTDQLTVTGLGVGGERFYSETLTPDDLTPRNG